MKTVKKIDCTKELSEVFVEVLVWSAEDMMEPECYRMMHSLNRLANLPVAGTVKPTRLELLIDLIEENWGFIDFTKRYIANLTNDQRPELRG